MDMLDSLLDADLATHTAWHMAPHAPPNPNDEPAVATPSPAKRHRHHSDADSTDQTNTNPAARTAWDYDDADDEHTQRTQTSMTNSDDNHEVSDDNRDHALQQDIEEAIDTAETRKFQEINATLSPFHIQITVDGPRPALQSLSPFLQKQILTIQFKHNTAIKRAISRLTGRDDTQYTSAHDFPNITPPMPPPPTNAQPQPDNNDPSTQTQPSTDASYDPNLDTPMDDTPLITDSDTQMQDDTSASLLNREDFPHVDDSTFGTLQTLFYRTPPSKRDAFFALTTHVHPDDLLPTIERWESLAQACAPTHLEESDDDL